MKREALELTIWGKHAVRQAVASSNTRVLEICLLSGDRSVEDLETEARKSQLRIQRMARNDLDRRLGTDKHQGVGARVELGVFGTLREWAPEKATPDSQETVVALDELQDPQNLGTLIRSAHFFGASAVLMTRDRCAPLTGTVAKASSGTLFSLPIIRATNLARELEQAGEAGFWRIGLTARAEKALFAIDLAKGKTLLVLGSEGEGMRPLTEKRCDELAALPGCGHGESLNVAVSASIALYEIARQRARK